MHTTLPTTPETARVRARRLAAAPGAPADPPRWSSDHRLALAASSAVLSAVGLLVLAAALGGAAQPSLVGDPGAVTRWGVLVTRTAQDIAAMCTIGVLAVAVLVLPTSRGALLPDAVRLVQLGSRWAAAWCVTLVLGFLMALSEATGQPVQDVLAGDVLSVGLQLPHTRALVSSLWLAGLVAAWARWTRSPAGGWLVAAHGGRCAPATARHRARRPPGAAHHRGRRPRAPRRHGVAVGRRPARPGAAPAPVPGGAGGRPAALQPAGARLLPGGRPVRRRHRLDGARRDLAAVDDGVRAAAARQDRSPRPARARWATCTAGGPSAR